MKNKEKFGGFVAISDFHSNKWPLEKIKYYLKEHDVIYILGDATDRGKDENGNSLDGDGGVQLLIDIMKLCKKNPDRIFYVPGNHDEFIYYIATLPENEISSYFKSYMSKINGSQTLKDLNELKKDNPILFNELVEWIGNLPLQKVHYDNVKGKKQRYCLAHAFFNESIYEQNPDFSLKDLFELYKENGYFSSDITWYRRNDPYDSEDIPSDSIVVVGHTPAYYKEDMYFDFIDANGESVKAVCVDGGITFSNGSMLKFVSGRNEVLTTPIFQHTPAPNMHFPYDDRNWQIEFMNWWHKLNNGRKAINKLLYAICKTQEKFEIFYTIIDNTRDMLNSLVDLSFSKYPNRHVSTRDGKAREIVSKVLPYAYAEGIIDRTEENRIKAKEITEAIRMYLTGSPDMTFLIPNKDANEDEIEVIEYKILRVILSVFQNTSRIIEEDDFLNKVSSANNNSDYNNLDYHCITFPEVAMINACYMMGYKDIEKLFDYSFDDLKSFTMRVRESYMNGDQDSMQENVKTK